MAPLLRHPTACAWWQLELLQSSWRWNLQKFRIGNTKVKAPRTRVFWNRVGYQYNLCKVLWTWIQNHKCFRNNLVSISNAIRCAMGSSAAEIGVTKAYSIYHCAVPSKTCLSVSHNKYQWAIAAFDCFVLFVLVSGFGLLQGGGLLCHNDQDQRTPQFWPYCCCHATAVRSNILLCLGLQLG